MDSGTLLLMGEALLAAGLLVFMVWWTMRDRVDTPPDQDEGDSERDDRESEAAPAPIHGPGESPRDGQPEHELNSPADCRDHASDSGPNCDSGGSSGGDSGSSSGD